jgi:hypothetical protein
MRLVVPISLFAVLVSSLLLHYDLTLADEDKARPPTDIEWIGEILPVGEVKVDVMQFAAPQRAIELFEKSERARKEDPWGTIKSSATAKSGEKLKQLALFGLTEEEQNEFQKLMKHISVIKVDDAVLTVSLTGPMTFRLEAEAPLQELDGITIDLRRKVTTTQHGILKDARNVDTPGGAFGAWKGVEWTLTQLLRLSIVSLEVGQLESGRMVIHLRTTKDLKRQDFIVFFDSRKGTK